PGGIAPDDPTLLRARLEPALAAHVVLTIGGVSVGEHDRVKECLESLGVGLDFWKVAMRPGKPIAFGRRGATYVLGLPGNPVSAMVTFELFARPLLLRLGGHGRIHRPVVRARIDRAYTKASGRTEFARGVLEGAP